MRICFLSLNASWSHSSMVAPLLERCCSDVEQWEWSLVESTINEAPEIVLERIQQQAPDVIIATCYLFTVEPILKVISRFSTLYPDTAVLLGGPEFLGKNQEFLNTHRYVTAVIRGEGEGVIRSILETIDDPDRKRWDFSEIQGVCFRDPVSGDIVDSGEAAIELPMDQLPNPYSSPLFDFSKKFVQIETARGCRAKCTFCTSALTDGGRMMTPDEVREDLLKIHASGIREIRVLDRTFNAPAKRAEELLRMFLGEFSDMHFHLEVYPNLVTDEMLSIIESAEAGQLHIEIGIQTTDTKVLSTIKRSSFNKRSHEVLKRLCELKHVPIHADLIVGLPNQHQAEVLSDLELLSLYQPEEVQMEVLKILPGTPLANDHMRYGIVHAPEAPYEVLASDSLGFSEIRGLMRISRALDQFYNHCELQTVVRKVWQLNPNFWYEFDSFLVNRLDVRAPLNLKVRYQELFQYLQQVDHRLAQELALEWVRNGHSPQKGLVEGMIWKAGIPENATPIGLDCSDTETLQPTSDFSAEVLRDSRIFHLEFEDRDIWIKLFRRSQNDIQVLGEWELAKSKSKSK